jgi:hypothetical protein
MRERSARICAPGEGLSESEPVETALTPTLSRKREREQKRGAFWHGVGRLPEINQIFNSRC